ncbi:MAG: hypothetical protein RR388_04285 [Rikenellaceae bacterium]
MKNLIFLTICYIALFGCKKDSDAYIDGGSVKADRFTKHFVQPSSYMTNKLKDTNMVSISIDGADITGLPNDNDCSSNYKEIAEKFGDKVKKEYYIWGGATPPTMAVIDTLKIVLTCINRDFDKDHKKGESLNDITYISFTSYSKLLNTNAISLTTDEIKNATCTMKLDQFNNQKHTFYGTYFYITLPPQKDDGDYKFRIYVYDSNSKPLKNEMSSWD